ncbi:hypothetical protein [Micromonospora sp. SH-82]|uniref:hypothetical protein n=1 Tax=Micromonospora sp. SH-82 TaxID=3132938 RepID=UPI003EB9C64A
MNSRIRTLPAVVLLGVLVAGVAACGDSSRDLPQADQAPPTTAPPAPATVPVEPSADPSAAPSPTGTAPTSAPATPAAPAPTAATAPPGASTARPQTSPPPVVLPPRPAAAPSARQVVAAFRTAGLKVSNVKDKSIDCGPDGLGLGCSELITTDAVRIYVFPDETSAADIADTWSGASYREGSVVLNYLGTSTSTTERARYDKVLADLR